MRPLPRRGDQVERWLKQQRDGFERDDVEWTALNDLLDLYRLHADIGSPLTDHASEGSAS